GGRCGRGGGGGAGGGGGGGGERVGAHEEPGRGGSRSEVVELVGLRRGCGDGCRARRDGPGGRRRPFDARARDVDLQPAYPGAFLPVGAGMEAPDAASGGDPPEGRSLAAPGIAGKSV